MFILVINQSNGTTIKPLKARSWAQAGIEETAILIAGGYAGSVYHSEIVKLRAGDVSQTYRDIDPIHHIHQEAIWKDRNCALIRHCR